MMNIGIVAFDGADELDFVGPYEVWHQAARAVPSIDVGLYALAGVREIVGAHGLRVRTEGSLPAFLDILMVPGGGWANHARRGVRSEIEAGALPAAIAAHHEAGTRIAGICTGALALAAAGILGKRPATTHASAIDDLRQTGAHIVDARVVDDGDVLTCGGVSSGLDLSLWLLETTYGEAVANQVARYLEYKRSTHVWRATTAVLSGTALI